MASASITNCNLTYLSDDLHFLFAAILFYFRSFFRFCRWVCVCVGVYMVCLTCSRRSFILVVRFCSSWSFWISHRYFLFILINRKLFPFTSLHVHVLVLLHLMERREHFLNLIQCNGHTHTYTATQTYNTEGISKLFFISNEFQIVNFVNLLFGSLLGILLLFSCVRQNQRIR